MTKITGLSLQPAGSSRDPRDLELDVQQRVVSVTVFHKGKATKKLTGTLAIPDAQPLYIHHMLVPPAAEADEMQYTLTLKNAEIETGTFKKTKARHDTLALTIFPTVQQYRTIADALCECSRQRGTSLAGAAMKRCDGQGNALRFSHSLRLRQLSRHLYPALVASPPSLSLLPAQAR